MATQTENDTMATSNMQQKQNGHDKMTTIAYNTATMTTNCMQQTRYIIACNRHDTLTTNNIHQSKTDMIT